MSINAYKQFDDYHIIHFLDECIDIIKEKYPEYYDDAKKMFTKKSISFCNIFIAKKEDFIKWGEFVFGVLLELDRKYNLNHQMHKNTRKHTIKQPKNTKNNHKNQISYVKIYL